MNSQAPSVTLAEASVEIFEHSLATSLKHHLLRRGPVLAPRKVVLLDRIDLSAAAGERIGVVGRNGSGKTTLLRLIAGIYPEASGARRVQGRIAPALAAGIGFDPELSVADNIGLGFAHLGFLRDYTPELAGRILDFAEMRGRAADPLKVLSLGFQSRLAFSLMLFQHADIFLVDELFATGDIAFKLKARRAVIEHLSRAPISFLVSHDEADILDVCTRCVLIDGGHLVADGTPREIVAEYHRRVNVP